MSNSQIGLASCLIQLKYGPEVGHLVMVIGGSDFITLKQIELRIASYPGATNVTIRPKDIGRMIGLLIWHKYAEFKNINDRAHYKIRLTEIVRILQYPRYLFHINELYDDRGSSILENILCHGQIDQLKIVRDQLTAEGALSGSVNEVEEFSREINDVFKHLVGTNFVKREPNLTEESKTNPSDVPEFEDMETQEKYAVIPDFTYANITAGSNGTSGEPTKKKARLTSNEDTNKIYWSINSDRFEKYLSDQIMVEDATEHCGLLAGKVLRNGLRVSEHGSDIKTTEFNVSYTDILQSCVESSINFDSMSFDHTLSLLVKNDYLRKNNEGLYTIKMRKIITRCYKNSVLQWIMTKYGNEARKILYLLQNGEYYEPHVIARLCLLDEKDAKRVLYRLMSDGIVRIQDIPRPGSNFTAQYSVYLFHADFRQIAHSIRKRLHQAQNNLAIRLVVEYNGVEQELKRREKINQMKNRVIIESDTETVTDDLELKEQDKIRLEKYDAAKDKLLTCLRSLEMELELNTLYHQYDEIRLKETVKAAKAK
jgi:hypothetical protein